MNSEIMDAEQSMHKVTKHEHEQAHLDVFGIAQSLFRVIFAAIVAVCQHVIWIIFALAHSSPLGYVCERDMVMSDE